MTEKKKEITEKEYSVNLIFNGEEYKTKDTDLRNAILKLKPEQLLTEIFAKVEYMGNKIERHLSLVQGKRLFMSDDFLDVFIINLNLEIYG